MEPVLAQLEEEYRGRVTFLSLNTRQERDLVSRYGVSYTPTYVFLDREGRVVSKLTGQQQAATMRQHIEKALRE